MFNLEATPYLLDETASKQVRIRLDAIEERVALLRRSGTLTEQTVRDYYGDKRFEQVAESNAIEGSTLSVGETELAVLHAWLTHIHPYIDGNGRTSRAIGNLELIRAGYPPIIIKKKERDRYIEALAESDEGGDIRSFVELVFDRLEGGLTGLEQSAKRRQGYNPIIEKIRLRQEKQLVIWETSVKLLASIIEHRATQSLEPVGGICSVKPFDSPLDLDDYLDVCAGRSVPRSWAFTVRLEVPGLSRLDKLAYIGHRSPNMVQALDKEGGPAIYWSRPNPERFPKWIGDGPSSPFAVEITSRGGNGDEWFARKSDGSIERVQTTDLAGRIADALVSQVNVE